MVRCRHKYRHTTDTVVEDPRPGMRALHPFPNTFSIPNILPIAQCIHPQHTLHHSSPDAFVTKRSLSRTVVHPPMHLSPTRSLSPNVFIPHIFSTPQHIGRSSRYNSNSTVHRLRQVVSDKIAKGVYHTLPIRIVLHLVLLG